MPQNYRSRDDRDERYDEQRRNRMRWGEDRDPYETGNERRYMSERDQDDDRGGFAGERAYQRGGYAEETGYRRDEPPREEREHRERSRRGPYSQFSDMRWNDSDEGAQYFGTGSHYGGGFGTAPSSRASAAGSWGAPGYAGQGAWSERDDDWRNTSGSPENYGGSRWGAQSGYGRSYGRPEQRWSGEGQHRGRGPKGYERSDERLREMICERLTDDPRIDASEIDVEVKQKIVRLTGVVEDRRTKFEVEDVIEHCGGVKDIDNQLRVKSRSAWGGQEGRQPQGQEPSRESRTGSTTKRS